MTDTRWQRLARMLEERRAEIRPEWVDRTAFARDNSLSYRTLSDLESARRENYRAAWLKQIEHAYRWQPGSIQRVLDGGNPVPIEEPANTQPADSPATIHEDHGPRPGSELGEGETLTWQRIDETRTRYWLHRGDGSGAMMTAPADASPEEVLAEIRDQIVRTIG